MPQNQFKLLTERRFAPLFIMQLLTLLNDHIFKSTLVIFITYNLISHTQDAQILINLASGLYGLPFIICAPIAGEFIDKYDRVKMVWLIKSIELVLMIGGLVAFYFSYLPLLFVVLFLLGAHSAFVGPMKYSTLPLLLKEDELLGGNGLIGATTILSILAGTILGTTMGSTWQGALNLSIATIVIASLGLIASFYIPLVAKGEPTLKINFNIFSEITYLIRTTSSHPDVFATILKISWFTFFSVALVTQYPVYTKAILGGSQNVVAFLFLSFAVGIAIGALLCNRILHGLIKSTLVIYSLIGISLFLFDLSWATSTISDSLLPKGSTVKMLLANPKGCRIFIDQFAIAILSGIYLIPLYALLQVKSELATRGRTMACNLLVTSVAGVIATSLVILLVLMSLNNAHIFAVIGVLNILVIIMIRKQKSVVTQ